MNLQILNSFEDVFQKCKGISRYSVEWSIISVNFLKQVYHRKKRATDRKEKEDLSLLFSYWLVTSNLLEVYHKHPITASFRGLKYETERQTIKGLLHEQERD